MMQQIEANWLMLGVAVLAVVLVAWWILRGSNKPRQRHFKPDVLDKGVGPAQRNQALIDAPPVAVVVAPAAGILGGIAEIIEHAGQEELERAAVQLSDPDAAVIPEAAPEPEVAPPVAPEPAPAPPGADDLSRIKGLGPKLKTILGGLGVTSFAQIAAWSEADLARIDSQLGAFAGRPAKDNWIEQARLLAAGDRADYEAKFGKL